MDKTTIILIIAVVVLIGVIVYLVRRYNYNRIMAQVQSMPTRVTNLNLNLRGGKEVNIFVNNWKATGKNISVPQYSVNLTINWTDATGASFTATETLLFPNFLSRVGTADLKEWLTELMVREARERLGVDQ